MMQQSVYLHILSSFNIILIGLATNGSTFCDHVHCENNNPCQTVFSQNKGDSRVSARCVCHGKWAGARCESEIYVTSGTITSTTAEVIISVKNPKNSTVPPANEDFSYTLMYWNNSTDHACSLIQELNSRTHRVVGLDPQRDYTICVESGVVETCLITYNNQTSVSTNCIYLTTSEFTSLPPNNKLAVIIAGILIVVAIVCVVVAAVLIKRRHYILIDNIFGLCSCCQCSPCCRRKHRNEFTAATDMIVSPDSPLMGTTSKVDFSPPSPGKPKHRLVKQRTRGYASYSAKNDRKVVLTTVLEYSQDGEPLEHDPLSYFT